MPRLENWSVGFHPDDKYKAPELRVACLRGNVYEHLDHTDGTLISTSKFVSSDRKANTVTTENGTTYKLGKVEPEYLNWIKTIGQTDPFPRIIESKENE